MSDSVVGIQADDAFRSTATKLAPAAVARGWKISAFIPTSIINHTGRLSSTDIITLDAAGHDMCSHGHEGGSYVDAYNDPTRGAAWVSAQLAASYAALGALGVVKGKRHFAAPGDHWNSTLTALAVAAGFQTVRDTHGTLLPSPWTLDLLGVAEWKTMDVINKAIADAKAAGDTLLCLVFHQIIEEACTPIKTQARISRMNAVLASVAASGLQVVKMSDVLDGVV